MVRYPQRVHSSTCPPSAPVRQARMALRTFRCRQENHFRQRSTKDLPAARITSATSKGGRSIYFVPLGPALLRNIGKASSGLATALRCRCETWR